MENQREEFRGLCDVLTEKGMILGETYDLLFDRHHSFFCIEASRHNPRAP